jgi:hypothetical protein
MRTELVSETSVILIDTSYSPTYFISKVTIYLWNSRGSFLRMNRIFTSPLRLSLFQGPYSPSEYHNLYLREKKVQAGAPNQTLTLTDTETKAENTAVGIHSSDHATPSVRKNCD